MKRFAVVLLLAGAVFALTQCDLFNTTVEYNVSGGPAPLTIRYNGEDGEIVDVSATAPWSTSFELFSSARPFIAFLRVTTGSGTAVNAYIREDGNTVDQSLNIPAPGSDDLYYIIE